MLTPEQKKNNLRLGLILGSIALIFFIGFMARLIFFGSAKSTVKTIGTPAAVSATSKPEVAAAK